MLLLPEWQTSETWEPSKSNAVSEIGALLKGLITMKLRLWVTGDTARYILRLGTL